MNRRRIIILAATTLFALSGCTGDGSGPSSAPPPTTSTKSGSPPPNVRLGPEHVGPEVSLAGIANDPCKMLTDAQIIREELKPGAEARKVDYGRTCAWKPKAFKGNSFEIATIVDNGGLDLIYRNRSEFHVFEPVLVGQFNGVHYDKANIDHGDCRTAVSLSKTQAITVSVNVRDRAAPEFTKPCSVSDRVALEAIDTLKGLG